MLSGRNWGNGKRACEMAFAVVMDIVTYLPGHGSGGIGEVRGKITEVMRHQRWAVSRSVHGDAIVCCRRPQLAGEAQVNILVAADHSFGVADLVRHGGRQSLRVRCSA